MSSSPIRDYRSLFPLLIIVAVLWTPLLIIQDVRHAGELMFEIIVIISLAVVLCKHLNVWFGLFLVLACVSMVFPYRSDSSLTALNYTLMGLAWISVLVMCKVDSDDLMDVMCVLALINLLWMVFQQWEIDPIFEVSAQLKASNLHNNIDNIVNTGFFSNQNETSMLFAFSVPAFLRGKWMYALPLLTAGMLISATIGSVIAIGCGLVFYAYMKHRLYSGVVVFYCIYAFALFYLFVDKPTFGRLGPWLKGWEIYTKHWVMGYGLGHWKLIFAKLSLDGVFKVWYNHAHNDLFQGIVEMGAGFGVILAGYYTSIVRKFTRSLTLPMMALIIITLCSLVSFPFHSPVAIIALTWMAIYQKDSIRIRDGKMRFGEFSKVFRVTGR